MAKKQKNILNFVDVNSFCENNKVLEYSHSSEGMRFNTLKGVLVMDGLSYSDFSSTHCSCKSIKNSHHTVVSTILKQCYGRSKSVYIID